MDDCIHYMNEILYLFEDNQNSLDHNYPLPSKNQKEKRKEKEGMAGLLGYSNKLTNHIQHHFTYM